MKMKIKAITGEKASFMGRSVFQNDKHVANVAAVALLVQYPTKEAQEAQGIVVSNKRYFRHNIVEGAADTLATAKAINGYFVKDESGQWMFISSNFCLNEGDLILNKDNKYFAVNERAEKIALYAKSHGFEAALAMDKGGLL